MRAILDTGQRESDHFDIVTYALTVVNGNFEICRNTGRYTGVDLEDGVTRLPPFPLAHFSSDTGPRYVRQQLLPKRVIGRPLMPYWWRDYIDVYFHKRESAEGLADGHLSVGFTGRIWFLFFPLSVFPAIWLLRKRREVRRRRAGLCVGCGYDLRGTPGKCPECGMAVKGNPGAGQQVAVV
jgi:hypothetical protein